MKPILIVKNIAREGPGILGDLLTRENLASTVVEAGRGERIPSPESFSAMVVLGGPASANDESRAMAHELSVIRDAVQQGIPFLGICLGLQTLVKAMGGEVVRHSVKECGFRDETGTPYAVHLTEDGRRDVLFRGLGSPLNLFQLHGETVVLQPDMVLLATGTHCRNQVVRVAPKAYGIQGHFELTATLLDVWMKEDPDLQPLDAAQMRRDYHAGAHAYTAVGERLFHNFLSLRETGGTNQ